MGEGRVAAQHLAVAGMHHAPADGVAELKFHLVEAFKHQPSPALRASCGHSIPLWADMDRLHATQPCCVTGMAVIKMLKIRRSLSAPAD
ncbi:hypothetical protein BwSH12_53160 [Bradyrhizobium ottawaense]|nr:hypothetical protein BwSF21_63060 [Bradyrhizobium ottawaense]GMO82192.1 hypothetical protein BwSG20_63770 [Bradyrhizobium ottawaense]GMP19311.1 hypothetical protein BwSH12_53160 [Bradyrhizobium ottawaense]